MKRRAVLRHKLLARKEAQTSEAGMKWMKALVAWCLLLTMANVPPALSQGVFQTLGVYPVSGTSPQEFSGTTQHGLQIAFTLASDCVPCGASVVCYQPTSALVEYREVMNGALPESVDVKFSYAAGNSSVHWWNVTCQSLVLAGPSPPEDICGPIWGYQGGFPCRGTCEFVFVREGASGVPTSTGAPESIQLSHNPMSDRVTISWRTDRAGTYRLRAYDVTGRMVKSLTQVGLPPGEHSYTWDATDDTGRRLGAGLLFLRLEGPGFVQSARLVVL